MHSSMADALLKSHRILQLLICHVIFAIPFSGSQVIDESLSLVCMHAILMGYQQQFIQ
jgi:hypothetical protein